MRASVRNAFVLGWLAVQVGLPVRAFFRERFESRNEFSWNMYSQDYSCEYRYLLLDRFGRPQVVKLEDHLHRPERQYMLFHRETLPRLHEYLCDSYVTSGGWRELRGAVTCRWSDEPRQLVRDGNLCREGDPL